MSPLKSLGSIWLVTATYIASTVGKKPYLVYLSENAQIHAVAKEEDAPKGADYVITMSENTKVEALSARLAYVALRQNN